MGESQFFKIPENAIGKFSEGGRFVDNDLRRRHDSEIGIFQQFGEKFAHHVGGEGYVVICHKDEITATLPGYFGTDVAGLGVGVCSP